MEKFIQDGYGTSVDLSQVAVVMPVTFRDPNTRDVMLEHSRVILNSGRAVGLALDFKTVWTKWQAVVNPAPATPAAPTPAAPAAA